MQEVVLMLYGNHALHPWQEDMFTRPDQLQARLGKEGLRFDVACAVQDPSGEDKLPEVRVAENPRYDNRGILAAADFRPGSIEDYPAVIDRWVANFQDEVVQDDGSVQRTAYGVGLPAARLINHKNVQYYGNNKTAMEGLLQESGVGVETWEVGDIERLADEYGEDSPVIFKPLGGAQSKGVKVFDSSQQVSAALHEQEIPSNGLVQPFFDVTQPIEGLVPLNFYQNEKLAEVNATSDRAREVRMHVMVTSDENGQRMAKAYPMLKAGAAGSERMPYQDLVALHPDSFPPESYVYQKTAEVGLKLAEAAGVPNLYAAGDWLFVPGRKGSELQPVIGDFNCRGPGLWHEATPSRRGFVEMLGSIASQNLEET